MRKALYVYIQNLNRTLPRSKHLSEDNFRFIMSTQKTDKQPALYIYKQGDFPIYISQAGIRYRWSNFHHCHIPV